MGKRVPWMGGWWMLWIATVSFPVQGDSLGLWESYQLALENDPAFQREFNLFRASGERVPQARAALLPQLTGVASHSRGYLEVDTPDDSAAGRSGDTRDGRREVSISPFNLDAGSVPLEDNYDNSQLSVKLSQTIFDRSQWLSLGSARSIASEARLELDDARRSLVLETAQAYYDLLSAQDALDVAGLELKAVDEQRELAERRYQQEIGTLTDVHEARARAELAKIDMINAQHNSSIAYHRLEKLISEPFEHVDRLPESFEPPPLLPTEESYWINTAIRNSIDIRSATGADRETGSEATEERPLAHTIARSGIDL